MSVIKLKCPDCEVVFPAENINIKTNKAHCKPCNSIHDIETLQLKEIDTSHKEISDPIPEIREISDHQGYTIEFDWKDFSNYKFHLTFGLIVTLFTLPIAIIFFMKLEIIGGFLTGLFSLLGLWLLNVGLQEYYNKTIIHFEGAKMNIYHQPFKLFLKEIECNQGDIQQLFVRKIDKGSSNGKNHYSHDLWAIINGKEQQLLSVFKNHKEAFYLERLIENHLNITDEIIKTEYQPGMPAYIDEEKLQKIANILQKVSEKRE